MRGRPSGEVVPSRPCKKSLVSCVSKLKGGNDLRGGGRKTSRGVEARMQAKGRHAHGGDPVGGVGHQVGVPPYRGWRCHKGHCVGEAGGWVGQG